MWNISEELYSQLSVFAVLPEAQQSLALEELIFALEPQFITFIQKYVRPDKKIQWILEKTFCGFAKKLRKGELRLESKKHLINLLFKILRWRIMDCLRGIYREEKDVLFSELGNSVGDLCSLKSENPLEMLIQKEKMSLREAMSRLPTKYQTVLELKYWKNLTSHEIAHQLHICVNTVNTHLFRARLQLKDILMN